MNLDIPSSQSDHGGNKALPTMSKIALRLYSEIRV
jgi:hypothetical protein